MTSQQETTTAVQRQRPTEAAVAVAARGGDGDGDGQVMPLSPFHGDSDDVVVLEVAGSFYAEEGSQNVDKTKRRKEGFFVPVSDEGMSSYCPRDLQLGGGKEENSLRAFETVGMVIGTSLNRNKVMF